MKIIVLHGFSGNAESLTQFVASLETTDDVIAVDLPGFGAHRDEPFELNWDSYTKAAQRCIDRIVDAHERFAIMGHSQGAMVAFCLAATVYRDRIVSVSLLAPIAKGSLLARLTNSALGSSRYVHAESAMTWLLRRQTLVDFVTRFSKDRDCSAAQYEALVAMRRQESSLYDTRMLQILQLIPKFSDENKSLTIVAPVTIATGDSDVLATEHDYEWYRQRCSNVHRVTFPGGHLSPLFHGNTCLYRATNTR